MAFQMLPDDMSASHLVASVLNSNAVLALVLRELYRIVPGLTVEDLKEILRNEVLRPEMLHGALAEQADAILKRASRLQSIGLSTTEMRKVISHPAGDDIEEDVHQILLDDKRHGGTAG